MSARCWAVWKEQPTRIIVQRPRKAGFVPLRNNSSRTVWANGSVKITVPDGHWMISPGVIGQIEKAIKESEK